MFKASYTLAASFRSIDDCMQTRPSPSPLRHCTTTTTASGCSPSPCTCADPTKGSPKQIKCGLMTRLITDIQAAAFIPEGLTRAVLNAVENLSTVVFQAFACGSCPDHPVTDTHRNELSYSVQTLFRACTSCMQSRRRCAPRTRLSLNRVSSERRKICRLHCRG
jgi:hypothetical protein